MSLVAGQQLAGKYLLLKRLGVGGMGEVWLAREQGLAGLTRHVAVKVTHAHLAEESGFVSMFLDEARISAQLTHGNIGRVLDLGEADGRYFLALEFVHGRDLKKLFRESRSRDTVIPVPLACWIIAEIAVALDYAHRKVDTDGHPLQLVHRDVSPQNCLVSFQGEVKLIDFGVAKAARRLTQTATNTIKGKLGYMAPDQLHGHPVDHRSDIFSLGVVLWELLAGRRLFDGDTELTTLELVRACEIPPLAGEQPGVNPDLEAVLGQALAVQPTERFQWASEFAAALQPFCFEDGRPVGRTGLTAYLKERFPAEEIPTAPVSLPQEDPLDLTAAATPPTLSGRGSATQATPPPQLPPRVDTGFDLVVEPLKEKKRGRTFLWLFATLLLAGVGIGGYQWALYEARLSAEGATTETSPGNEKPLAPSPAPEADTPKSPEPPAPPEVEPEPPAAAEAVPTPAPSPEREPKRRKRRGKRRPRPTATAPSAPTADLPPPTPAPKAASSGKTSDLWLEANTPSIVYVDGKKVGRTPINGYAVTPGRHTVRFDCLLESGLHRGRDRSVNIPDGSEATIRHTCTVTKMK